MEIIINEKQMSKILESDEGSAVKKYAFLIWKKYGLKNYGDTEKYLSSGITYDDYLTWAIEFLGGKEKIQELLDSFKGTKLHSDINDSNFDFIISDIWFENYSIMYDVIIDGDGTVPILTSPEENVYDNIKIGEMNTGYEEEVAEDVSEMIDYFVWQFLKKHNFIFCEHYIDDVNVISHENFNLIDKKSGEPILESSRRYKLDNENVSTIQNLISDLYDEIRTSRKRNMYLFKHIPVTTIDGTKYELPVFLDPSFEGYAGIVYDTRIPLSVNNLALVVNPKNTKSRKHLYNSLYHEFLHAVDPTITTKPSEKYQSKYGDPNERPDLYYSHGIELRGITGEFFEALVNEFKERKEYVKDEEDRELLLKSINNIVAFFNELEMLSPLSYDIVHSMNGEYDLDNRFKSILKNLYKFYPKASEFMEEIPDEEPYFIACIDMIRHFSPKGWKRFLTMLYSTKMEIEDILKK